MARPRGLPKTGGRPKGVIPVSLEITEQQAEKFVANQIVNELVTLPDLAGLPAKSKVDLEVLARRYAPYVLQAMFKLVLTSPSHSARVAAATIILDRGYGRAAQSVQVTGEIALRAVSDSELAVMAGRLAEHFATVEGEADEIAGELGELATVGA